MEAVAIGGVVRDDAVDLEGDDFRLLGLAPKVQRIACSGRTQRRLAPAAEALPQRIDFGQGKDRITAGTISAMA
jgi:hypothetical protein